MYNIRYVKILTICSNFFSFYMMNIFNVSFLEKHNMKQKHLKILKKYQNLMCLKFKKLDTLKKSSKAHG